MLRANHFFLYAPLTSPHLPVVTNQEYRGKSRAGESGDFVVETDAFLGAILETLDRLHLADDTFVPFTSDNGGLYHYWEAKEATACPSSSVGWGKTPAGTVSPVYRTRVNNWGRRRSFGVVVSGRICFHVADRIFTTLANGSGNPFRVSCFHGAKC